MRLAELLRPAHVAVPLEAETVTEAVSRLADLLVESGAVADPDELRERLGELRERDLVKVGERVVFPHLRTDAVRELTAALGVTTRPVAAGGDVAARVVVLVLAPPSAAATYLQTVAALARVVREDEAVDRLVAARSPAEALAIPEIAEAVVQPRILVRDVMTPRVYRVTPETTVRGALDLLVRHRLHAVPVIGPEREVLGMVSDRDLLRHLLPRLQQRAGGAVETQPPGPETLVRDVMARSVICVSEEQPLAEVASMMVAKDLERLPVTHEGQLTGFLTRADILRKLFG